MIRKIEETENKIKNILEKHNIGYVRTGHASSETDSVKFSIPLGYVSITYSITETPQDLIIYEVIEDAKTPCEVQNAKITYEILHTRTVETKDENMFFETLESICSKSSQMP